MKIAIADHQHIVPGSRKHVDQIRDLAVGPMRRVVNYDGDVTSGKAVLQPLRNGKRWIGPVLNPENNLESRISLAAAGCECFLEQGFVAAERLQDGHGGKP